MSEAHEAVAAAARTARQAAETLAHADQSAIDGALLAMAALLDEAAEPILAANQTDQDAAACSGMSGGLLDRLRLDRQRLSAMAGQLRQLAAVPPEDGRAVVRKLAGNLVVEEVRRPIGVIGANFEARPNVTVDVASQLIKSRNGGVLRTGSAALASAAALMDHVVSPALARAGLDPQAIQLVRVKGRESAAALVSQGSLLPLVILRGSGESTRQLAELGAAHGVRTLAHADGGAVVFVDKHADDAKTAAIIEQSLDRLGVCNRLNLLLIHKDRWESTVPGVVEQLARLTPPIKASLPPHSHALGHEWALDSDAEATVTIAAADSAVHAAAIANDHTSGLAAAIITEDAAQARAFLSAYSGTGAFWNATTRLLDGFKMLGLPETGINIDRVPGPRGPVTFRDLYLRQYVVVPQDGMET